MMVIVMAVSTIGLNIIIIITLLRSIQVLTREGIQTEGHVSWTLKNEEMKEWLNREF